MVIDMGLHLIYVLVLCSLFQRYTNMAYVVRRQKLYLLLTLTFKLMLLLDLTLLIAITTLLLFALLIH